MSQLSRGTSSRAYADVAFTGTRPTDCCFTQMTYVKGTWQMTGGGGPP